jgi:hypothetical protein
MPKADAFLDNCEKVNVMLNQVALEETGETHRDLLPP